MENFKLSVSKNGKKYNIVFKAENEKEARDRVHKEWYSILSVEKISEESNIWNTFYFTAYTQNGDLKRWRIVWDDIFKIYIKLNMIFTFFKIRSIYPPFKLKKKKIS